MTDISTIFAALARSILDNDSVAASELDYAPYADLMHDAYFALNQENADYLTDIGQFTYMLVTQAQTDAERDRLTEFCCDMLAHLVDFNIAQNVTELAAE